jgi:hypothetical protein
MAAAIPARMAEIPVVAGVGVRARKLAGRRRNRGLSRTAAPALPAGPLLTRPFSLEEDAPKEKDDQAKKPHDY